MSRSGLRSLLVETITAQKSIFLGNILVWAIVKMAGAMV